MSAVQCHHEHSDMAFIIHDSLRWGGRGCDRLEPRVWSRSEGNSFKERWESGGTGLWAGWWRLACLEAFWGTVMNARDLSPDGCS